MNIFRLSFALLAVLVLSSCAALSGGRHYDYSTEVKADGSKKCTFSVDSNSVLTGVTLSACDGSMTATATGVQQGNSAADFNLLLSNFQNALLGKPPVATPAQPAPATPPK